MMKNTCIRNREYGMNKLRYIKDYLIEKRHKYLLGILSLLMVDVLQLVLPKILGNITDLLKEGLLTKNILAKYMFIITLIALGVAVFRFFYRYFVYGTSKYIETELRNRYYNHLQKLSANYYNSHKTGDLMAHATNDINNIRAMLWRTALMQ
jgi:ATP-binding cassette subfamily B multidrug efflux pump